MVYEDKKLSEMTAEEKARCIQDAERSFYAIDNFGRRASTLFEQHMEIRGLMDDKKLQAALKKLHDIEDQVSALSDEYDAKVNNALIPLVRGHKQQLQQLDARHQKERDTALDKTTSVRRFSISRLMAKQSKELSDLIKQQAAETEALKNKVAKKLHQKQGVLFSLFMSQIHQIYK